MPDAKIMVRPRLKSAPEWQWNVRLVADGGFDFMICTDGYRHFSKSYAIQLARKISKRTGLEWEMDDE